MFQTIYEQFFLNIYVSVLYLKMYTALSLWSNSLILWIMSSCIIYSIVHVHILSTQWSLQLSSNRDSKFIYSSGVHLMERVGSWSHCCDSWLQTLQWMTSWGHSSLSTALSQPQEAEGSRLTPQECCPLQKIRTKLDRGSIRSSQSDAHLLKKWVIADNWKCCLWHLFWLD